MTVLRAVVVEDEPLARAYLRELLAEDERLELVGEAADGRSAVEAIDRLAPDLVFLDVQMPELSGLEVLERARHRPRVVFTTAHDRYAVTAFELEALDYLVKPFGRERFRATLDRICRQLDPSAAAPGSGLGSTEPERVAQALGEGPLVRFFARVGSRIEPVPIRDVVRFEAEGDYVRAHLDSASHLLHVGLGELARRLDPATFLRVHRSHVVNLDRVARMEEHDERRLALVFSDDSRVVASRSGSALLRTMIR